MKGTHSIAFCVSACMLLAGSIVFGRQQGQLSGIVAASEDMTSWQAGEITGRISSAFRSSERLRPNGDELRLGGR